MARVITITSGKGGVGKTTVTANLSAALVGLNQRVICIDADIGLRNLDLILGVENRIRHDLVDVVEGRVQLPQAIIRHKVFPNLSVIPAAQDRDKTAVSPTQMVGIVRDLEALREEDANMEMARPRYDFILIDSPAGIERGFKNAVTPAREVLVVTNPEVSAVRDADRVIGLLEAIEPKPPQIRLIINRAKQEMMRRGEMLSEDDVRDMLSIDLIGIVPDDENVLIAGNKGTPDLTSKAGAAFQQIARRLMGESIPLHGGRSGAAQGGFLRRLSKLFSGQ
ncbi:MAG TPA: septum site-determining protein MinD [Aggregatilineales bacterium]|nr:septum site-determining protein MinD [Anaerolineales bacterium]HRE48305.1 septum site-determining protein MinD [Aggregatilineales bacterium]